MVGDCSGKVCAKCDEKAYRVHGDRPLCVVHFRFETMRDAARSKGKVVPTHDDLRRMADEIIQNGLACPHCGRQMHWTKPPQRRSDVVSLQHDRSGRLRLLCMGCNIKHATYPGDTFYDAPIGWSFCHRCHQSLPPESFYKNRMGACCRSCRKVLNREMWALYGRKWAENSRRRHANN